MKKLFIKKINWVLAGIMGLFGFTGCDIFERALYAAPYADYSIKGAVVNEVTGKPIKGIRVSYSPVEWDIDLFGQPPWDQNERYDYVITNENGAFSFTTSGGYGFRNSIVPIYAEDIDGEENGLFQPRKIEVDFNEAVQTGNPGDWYEGEFTVTTTIQLVEVEVE